MKAKVAACGITHDELDWPTPMTCRNGHLLDAITPGQEMSGVVAAPARRLKPT
jgi:hypothetical protein